MAETCSKNEYNLIAEKSWFELHDLHLCFPLQLSASVDLSVSVVTSAGEQRLGVSHVYAWDVMGLQSHANAQTSQSADAPEAAASKSAPPVVSISYPSPGLGHGCLIVLGDLHQTSNNLWPACVI